MDLLPLWSWSRFWELWG